MVLGQPPSILKTRAGQEIRDPSFPSRRADKPAFISIGFVGLPFDSDFPAA